MLKIIYFIYFSLLTFLWKGILLIYLRYMLHLISFIKILTYFLNLIDISLIQLCYFFPFLNVNKTLLWEKKFFHKLWLNYCFKPFLYPPLQKWFVQKFLKCRSIHRLINIFKRKRPFLKVSVLSRERAHRIL